MDSESYVSFGGGGGIMPFKCLQSDHIILSGIDETLTKYW